MRPISAMQKMQRFFRPLWARRRASALQPLDERVAFAVRPLLRLVARLQRELLRKGCAMHGHEIEIPLAIHPDPQLKARLPIDDDPLHSKPKIPDHTVSTQMRHKP